MRVSLVITTYNSPDALLLVLKSIETQFTLPSEVIIADDGSNDSTKEIIDSFKLSSNLTIVHSWQEDKGFRAAKSRNQAISLTNEAYIVLIDGDVILHPEFIHDHIKNAEKGFFIQGSRVFLSKESSKDAVMNKKTGFSFFSPGIKNAKNAIHSNFLSKLFIKKNKKIKGIKTCNMSFFKQDCININGFNEDFEGWGREDSEFVVRFFNSGILRKNIRFNAIQFHLWHSQNNRDSLMQNDFILRSSINKNSNWSKNGIDKYLK
jgi:glycosyltransferase involved in cell wall biosynthesis